MKNKIIPAASFLAECVRYDPSSGALTWDERPLAHFADTRIAKIWNTRFAGKPAFSTPNGHGYLVGTINGVPLLAHRIAATLLFGDIMGYQIDHIDGDRRNNRAANLRRVDALANRRNARRPNHNSSGHIGVAFRASKNAWRASITVGNRSRHLGYYPTLKAAVAARKTAESALGFHPNHGRPKCA